MLTYGGFLDPIVARAKSLVNPEIEGATKQATNRIKQIDKEIKRLFKTQPYRDLPDIDKKKLVDNFMDILEGTDPNSLPSKYIKDTKGRGKFVTERLVRGDG